MVFPFKIITHSAEETQKLGKEIGHSFLTKAILGSETSICKGSARVLQCILCLYGELGSGKTTFVQGFAKGMGIASRLLSPTFIIVRRYAASGNVWFHHIDLYRLTSIEEMKELGLTEIFEDSASVSVIEWAERLGTLLPEERIDIKFIVLPDGSHEIRGAMRNY